MVIVNFYINGFQAIGHALFDDYNKDIVCAGVSAIVIGGINWLPKKAIKKIDTNSEKGFIRIEFNYPISSDVKKLMSIIKTQLVSIEKEYNDFLKIKVHKCKIS